jgi:hypothetical protein
VQAPDARVTILGHTRWASVGIISEPNTHPLNSVELEQAAGDTPAYVVAALNGDVDNHADLRAAHALRISSTITTDAKVIPTLVSRHAATAPLAEAFRRTVSEFEGRMPELGEQPRDAHAQRFRTAELGVGDQVGRHEAVGGVAGHSVPKQQPVAHHDLRAGRKAKPVGDQRWSGVRRDADLDVTGVPRGQLRPERVASVVEDHGPERRWGVALAAGRDVRDERATTLPGDHQTLGAQQPECETNRVAGDAVPVHQAGFGRQLPSGRQMSLLDLDPQLVCNLAVQRSTVPFIQGHSGHLHRAHAVGRPDNLTRTSLCVKMTPVWNEWYRYYNRQLFAYWNERSAVSHKPIARATTPEPCRR